MNKAILCFTQYAFSKQSPLCKTSQYVNKPIISIRMLSVDSHNACIPHTTTQTTTELKKRKKAEKEEGEETHQANRFHSVPTAAKYP